MKVALTLDNFPMHFVDTMEKELRKRIPSVDIQVGGESTVFVTFTSDDIVKIQEGCIICDKYRFGGEEDDDSFLYSDD